MQVKWSCEIALGLFVEHTKHTIINFPAPSRHFHRPQIATNAESSAQCLCNAEQQPAFFNSTKSRSVASVRENCAVAFITAQITRAISDLGVVHGRVPRTIHYSWERAEREMEENTPHSRTHKGGRAAHERTHSRPIIPNKSSGGPSTCVWWTFDEEQRRPARNSICMRQKTHSLTAWREIVSNFLCARLHSHLLTLIGVSAMLTR
jgi:hypothetical protein